jgi:hypothetical protein
MSKLNVVPEGVSMRQELRGQAIEARIRQCGFDMSVLLDLLRGHAKVGIFFLQLTIADMLAHQILQTTPIDIDLMFGIIVEQLFDKGLDAQLMSGSVSGSQLIPSKIQIAWT